MYYALVYYPEIEQKEFHELRHKYEPYADLMPEHLGVLMPVPATVGFDTIEIHIKSILAKWRPFDVHFCKLERSWDQWLYLTLKEGNQQVIELHDELHGGILLPYLRKDLPYTPHVGLGIFSKEKYDINNPTAQLSLDQEKYQKGKSEFDKLNLDFWRTIGHLTLVKVNSDFTECWDVKEYSLVG